MFNIVSKGVAIVAAIWFSAMAVADVPSPVVVVEGCSKSAVVEQFVSFRCAACKKQSVWFESWAKTVPAPVAVQHIPVVVTQADVLPAAIYYAIELTESADTVERARTALYEYIGGPRYDPTDTAALLAIVDSVGVDRRKFRVAVNSETVRKRLTDGAEKTVKYGVVETPTAVVGGCKATSIAKAGGNVDIYRQLLNGLVTELLGDVHGN